MDGTIMEAKEDDEEMGDIDDPQMKTGRDKQR